jgi:hypothetical protein
MKRRCENALRGSADFQSAVSRTSSPQAARFGVKPVQKSRIFKTEQNRTKPNGNARGPLNEPVGRLPRLSALVARPAVGRLRAFALHSSGKNADKIRTKHGQNRNCDFFNPRLSTTCNFNALKCPDFSSLLNPNPNPNPNPNLAAKRAGSPNKMGKNGTNYDSHKIERLRRSHLRRLPFAMSHFQFSLRNSSFLRISSLVIRHCQLGA